jgi:hypothetical protein
LYNDAVSRRVLKRLICCQDLDEKEGRNVQAFYCKQELLVVVVATLDPHERAQNQLRRAPPQIRAWRRMAEFSGVFADGESADAA